jgi:hypothetical protein
MKVLVDICGKYGKDPFHRSKTFRTRTICSRKEWKEAAGAVDDETREHVPIWMDYYC